MPHICKSKCCFLSAIVFLKERLFLFFCFALNALCIKSPTTALKNENWSPEPGQEVLGAPKVSGNSLRWDMWACPQRDARKGGKRGGGWQLSMKAGKRLWECCCSLYEMWSWSLSQLGSSPVHGGHLGVLKRLCTFEHTLRLLTLHRLLPWRSDFMPKKTTVTRSAT